MVEHFYVWVGVEELANLIEISLGTWCLIVNIRDKESSISS